MRCIIAGTREIEDMDLVVRAVHESRIRITEVVCGMARGVDMLGRMWGDERGIPVKYFPADWEQHGRAAGYKRNEAMAEYAQALVAVWDGRSKGTLNMIRLARKRKLRVYVLNLERERTRNPPRNGSRPRTIFDEEAA
jgi:hypothetical protein